MTEDLGGAKIYLKREDLNHTGAHKINNVLGQALLAKRWARPALSPRPAQVSTAYEEKDEFAPLCRQYGVDLISMIAPTSENRIAMIAKEAEGFLYIVSSLGVTGTRSEIKTDLAAIVKVVRENTKTPCAIGFGISTPEQAAKMAGIADGAIVGSAIIKLLEQYGTAAPEQIGAYVKRMKDAVRG